MSLWSRANLAVLEVVWNRRLCRAQRELIERLNTDIHRATRTQLEARREAVSLRNELAQLHVKYEKLLGNYAEQRGIVARVEELRDRLRNASGGSRIVISITAALQGGQNGV